MTVVVFFTWNDSGRAPYLSSLTSWLACVWPPMLVICTLPAGMACVVCGAETTFPSSTIAVWSSTELLAFVVTVG